LTNQEIEHMWKVATNNPHHDTNWHDPAVVKFAELVAAHTLMNTDPSKFMSHQEGIEIGAAKGRAEIEWLKALCQEMLSELYVYRASEYLKDVTAAIQARGR